MCRHAIFSWPISVRFSASSGDLPHRQRAPLCRVVLHRTMSADPLGLSRRRHVLMAHRWLIENTVKPPSKFDKDLLPSLRVINLEEGEVRPQMAVQQLGATVAAILAVLALTLR